MRIAILTWGTRGDVQPYLALADELARRGHQPTLAVNQNHLAWVGRTDIPALELPFDFQAALDSVEARAWLAAGKTTQFLRWFAGAEDAVRDQLSGAVVDACAGADAIVSSLAIGYRAAVVAEKMDVPLVRVSPSPFAPTESYPSPYLGTPLVRMPFAPVRRLSHQIIQNLLIRRQRAALAEFRRKLGLLEPAGSPEADLVRRGTRTLNVFSPLVLPRPPDWPADHVITGYCRLPDRLRAPLGEEAVPPELGRWIDAGSPPIFFGFGSMPIVDRRGALAMIRDVCRAVRARGLIDAGATDLGDVDDRNLRIVGPFNHDAVLPRCRAAVHHGGAGTTGTSLTAGIPSVIAWVLGDQPFWGDRVESLGTGAALPFRKLTVSRLRAALGRALSPSSVARAASLGRDLRGEDGLRRTADSLIEMLAPRRQASQTMGPVPLSN